MIRDFSNNNGDEDDASTKVSETNDDKHEEEVDKASLKPGKLKKNGSICLEKSATVKMNPLMSTCQCGCSKPGKVFICKNYNITFKCKDEYDFHNLKYSQEVNIREIKMFLMSTGQCEDEPLISWKVGDFTWIMKAHHGRHTKKASWLKPEATSRRK